MEYRPEDLKRLQDTELDILKEIIRVCERNQIQYFGVYGTLLGAVRHGGFIPWDDDIDIGMLREDYERFLKIAPTQLKKGYTLQHFSVDPNAPAYFAKVRKDGTRFLEKNLRHLPIHHGIFVDIFTYDAVPEDLKERERYNRRIQIWFQIYNAKSLWTTAKHIIPVWYKRYAVNAVRIMLHILLLPVKKEYLFRKLDLAMRCYDKQDTALVSERGGVTPACALDDYFPVQMKAFGDIQIAVPNHYDKVLTKNYGDYMQLPPEGKRISHSPQELAFENASN